MFAEGSKQQTRSRGSPSTSIFETNILCWSWGRWVTQIKVCFYSFLLLNHNTIQYFLVSKVCPNCLSKTKAMNRITNRRQRNQNQNLSHLLWEFLTWNFYVTLNIWTNYYVISKWQSEKPCAHYDFSLFFSTCLGSCL